MEWNICKNKERSSQQKTLVLRCPFRLFLALLLISVPLSLTNAQVLSPVEAVFDGDGGAEGLAGAVSLALSPDENHLYVAGNSDSALVVFEVTGTASTVRFDTWKRRSTG